MNYSASDDDDDDGLCERDVVQPDDSILLQRIKLWYANTFICGNITIFHVEY